MFILPRFIFRFYPKLVCPFLAVFASAYAGASEAKVSVHLTDTELQSALSVTTDRAAGFEQGYGLLTRLANTREEAVGFEGAEADYPWLSVADEVSAVTIGGWDMGRSEAQVRAPAKADTPTGTYILAKTKTGYALAGFVTWKTFNSKIEYRDGGLHVTVDGEGRLIAPGETVALETVWMAKGENWQDLLFAYADEIAKQNDIHLNHPKPYVGWATWDYYGRNWTFQSVTENLDALLKIYPKADFLQIDGGWWPERGDYMKVRKDLQPDGMKRLSQVIRDHGLVAGIHLDGMRGDAKADVAQSHPDYFLHDQNGKMIVQKTMNVGDALDYTFFDYSNPGARDYITKVLDHIRHDWGYSYFKVDFLRYGLNEFILGDLKGRRGKKSDEDVEIVPHDRSLTSVERFHLGMAAMRRGMGADAYFVACSSVFGPTFGHVDGLRAGADINPQFKQFKRCVVDTVGNFYLHGKVVYNDADYHVVRGAKDQDDTRVQAANKDGSALTFNEAEMWTHYVGLFGGPKLNSDKLSILSEKRRELFKLAASLPTAERYVPIDLWSHATDDSDPPSVILSVAKGELYLGVFNWTDTDREIRISGFSGMDLSGLVELAGAGELTKGDGSISVSLAARHSSIFKISNDEFDRVRKALVVE